MNKTLTQIGNSWGIIIPKTLLNLMKINPSKDEVEFEFIKDEIIIRKAKKQDKN